MAEQASLFAIVIVELMSQQFVAQSLFPQNHSDNAAMHIDCNFDVVPLSAPSTVT